MNISCKNIEIREIYSVMPLFWRKKRAEISINKKMTLTFYFEVKETSCNEFIY
jgi:hypothetical protein